MKEERRQKLIQKGWLSESKLANYVGYATLIAFAVTTVLCIAVIV